MTFKHSNPFVYYLKIFSVYGLASPLCIKYTPKPVTKTFQPQLRLSSEPGKEHISHQKTTHSELKPQFSSKNYKTYKKDQKKFILNLDLQIKMFQDKIGFTVI